MAIVVVVSEAIPTLLEVMSETDEEAGEERDADVSAMIAAAKGDFARMQIAVSMLTAFSEIVDEIEVEHPGFADRTQARIFEKMKQNEDGRHEGH